MNVHNFETSGEAYDAVQCDKSINTGDILVIASERVVGVADTWPFAVTKEEGRLHQIDCDSSHFIATYPEFSAPITKARAVAFEYGFETI